MIIYDFENNRKLSFDEENINEERDAFFTVLNVCHVNTVIRRHIIALAKEGLVFLEDLDGKKITDFTEMESDVHENEVNLAYISEKFNFKFMSEQEITDAFREENECDS